MFHLYKTQKCTGCIRIYCVYCHTATLTYKDVYGALEDTVNITVSHLMYLGHAARANPEDAGGGLGQHVRPQTHK